jgi:hypothetical protein
VIGGRDIALPMHQVSPIVFVQITPKASMSAFTLIFEMGSRAFKALSEYP